MGQKTNTNNFRSIAHSKKKKNLYTQWNAFWFQNINSSQYNKIFIEDLQLEKYIKNSLRHLNCASDIFLLRSKKHVQIKIILKPLNNLDTKTKEIYNKFILLLQKKLKKNLNKKNNSLISIKIILENTNKITNENLIISHSIENYLKKKKIAYIKKEQANYYLKLLIKILQTQKNTEKTNKIIKEFITNLYKKKKSLNGIKIKISGRIDGVEMATSEQYTKGKISLSTLNNCIDFAFSDIITKYGKIGIKIWLNWKE